MWLAASREKPRGFQPQRSVTHKFLLLGSALDSMVPPKSTQPEARPLVITVAWDPGMLNDSELSKTFRTAIRP
ncbi:MAG: hypothetical protein KatS3mg057_1921 [Herpetosiphonaceae bacterium]|nr:MAG: hypothetical protein KatS3mg057_1921 [Herpetosiphonaceae bacterium]